MKVEQQLQAIPYMNRRNGSVEDEVSHSIDVLRGMAALGVIWGHSMYGLAWPSELNGAFWVWIFLPISGYLIGSGFSSQRYRLDANGYKRFLRNRSLRIIPLYQIALMIGLILEFLSGERETTMLSVLRQSLFMARHTTLSGPLWTVAAEMLFYLFSIIVVWLIIRYGKSRFKNIVIWILSFGLASIYVHMTDDIIIQPRSFLGNFHYFVFGIIIAVGPWGRCIAISRTMQILSIGGCIAVAWILNNWNTAQFWGVAGWYANLPIGSASFCALTVTTLVLCRKSKPGYGDRLWRSVYSRFFARCLAWCGFHTYGIYVWHAILLKANKSILNVPVGPFLLIVLLTSVPIARFSYRWLEEPFLGFKSYPREKKYPASTCG